MVRSVEEILKTEFNRLLSDAGVHIIDPFVGHGQFHRADDARDSQDRVRQKSTLTELHCNEVMLLPYYIASMNIEHEFYEATGRYQPFNGICLVDTFELAEDTDYYASSLFTEENTRRVEEQKKAPMFVSYRQSALQCRNRLDENDNNPGTGRYPAMDARIRDTYSQDSTATCSEIQLY